jgi:hypothetical protein
LGDDGKPEKKKDMDHMCFSSNTLVATPNGAIAFKNLPESGFIYVDSETIAPYTNCGIKKPLAQTLKVTLDNGKIIECTPDHKFLTEQGWRECQNLLNQEILCSKLIQQYQENSNFLMGLNTKDAAKAAAFGILLGQTLLRVKPNICTAKSGNIIAAKSLEVFKFIIKTLIHLTTNWTILSALKPLNICDCIIRNGKSAILKGMHSVKKQALLTLVNTPLYGIKRMKQERCTVQTQKQSLSETAKLYLKKLVQFAIKDFSHAWESKNFAPKNATTLTRLETVDHQVLITNQENVNIADLNLSPINTLKNLDVLQRVRVISIEPSKNQDVYCLTVPSHGYFLLADGEIVKNCDAAGYAAYRLLPIRAGSGFGTSRARG